MRILFDGYWWNEGPFSNRTVMRAFVTHWRKQFPDDELHVLVPGSVPTADRPPGVTFHRTRLPLQALINAVALPALGRRIGAELLVAHNFSPLSGPSAVFVHDLMFVDHPEWFTAAENAYFRGMVWGARRAKRLLTSSAAEAARIARITGRADVAPIGLGLGAGLLAAVAAEPGPEPPEDRADLAAVAQGRFLLAVGRLNVRKNLALTVRALVADGIVSADFPLLVVGESSGRVPPEDEVVRRAVADGSVVFLGAVGDAQLRRLYERCAAFVFMSLDEGFGLPCLEAQTFGAPAAVSDIPPFHEILGAEGHYADPLDQEAIAAAVRGALARGRSRSAGAGGGVGSAGGSGTKVSAATSDEHWARCVRGLRASLVAPEPEPMRGSLR